MSEDTIYFDEVKPYLPKKVTPITISKKDEEELQHDDDSHATSNSAANI